MLSLKRFSFLICIILISTKSYLVQGKYVLWPTIQRSIAQYTVISTWDNAKRHCDNQGAMLASPIDAGLVKHMREIIGVNNHTTPYFIGIKARLDGEFVSEEGILLEDISEAAIYMIDQIDPRNGDCLCMDKHSIRAVSCLSQLPYMCYKNATAVSKNTLSTGAPTATVTQNSTTVLSQLLNKQNYSSKRLANYDAEGAETRAASDKTKQKCEQNGYKQYETGCYKLHDTALTWDEAKALCEGEGAYLVIINDKTEAEIVFNITFHSSNIYYASVGLRAESGTGDWRSIHGDRISNLYNIWDEDDPVKYKCGGMKENGKLDTIPCNPQEYYFVCEK